MDRAPLPEAAFALSVDVEDYYQVQAFRKVVPRGEWGRYPSRVVANTERLLDLFDEVGAKGTFFVLGCVARQHPHLVQRIASRGNEIASHGITHTMLTELSPQAFRAEALDSKLMLQDLSARPVIGFRAPSYSVNRSTLWALEILRETGYEYDSSVYPIRRRRYGYPGGPLRPARIAAGKRDIAEFPLPTVPFGPLRFPVLAGAYLRLLPAWASLAAADYHLRRGIPFVVSVHPWEIDPEQPTIGPSRAGTWTHYARLSRTADILGRVLRRARCSTVAEQLSALGLLPAPALPGGSS